MKSYSFVGIQRGITLGAVTFASLALVATGAGAQGTRSSGGVAGNGNPLFDIAVGLDPLTGQPASVPFTAPTTFGSTGALPPLVSTTGAQPIFISDAELGATASVPGTPGANAGFGFVDTSGAATQFFISDAELGGGQMVATDGGAAFSGFASTDAIVGRLPGDLPIVGPEYTQEIPGIGLSVVQPIQSVSATRAQEIATDLLSVSTSFSGSTGTVANVGSSADVPVGLPSPSIRQNVPAAYISGNLAACRQGYASCQTNQNNLASPNPVASTTPTTTVANLNQPIVEGTPATFTTLAQTNAADTETPAATTPATTTPTPATVTAATDPAPSTAPAANDGTACAGPMVIQFNDDAKELASSQEQMLRGLVVACREDKPGAVYSVVAYPDAAQAGSATARQTSGARLFAVRFALVSAGVSISDLELSTDVDSTTYSNALVVNIQG